MATHTTTLWVNEAEAQIISDLLTHNQEGQAALQEYSYYAATRIDSTNHAGFFEIDVSRMGDDKVPSVNITLSDENAIPKSCRKLNREAGAQLFSRDGQYTFRDGQSNFLLNIQILNCNNIESNLPVTIKTQDMADDTEIRFNSLNEFQIALPEIEKEINLNSKIDFWLGDKLYNNVTIVDFNNEIKKELAYYKKIENFIKKNKNKQIKHKNKGLIKGR